MLDIDKSVLICGAGGFIGGHLIQRLYSLGFKTIRAIDVKPLQQWYQVENKIENTVMDLQEKGHCYDVCQDVDYVFNLAADMGGMGFIELNKASCMLSSLINTHLLMAARDCEVERYFYASSACVYAADKQTHSAVTALREEDAYPAMPEDGYGWEKLFSERMCRHFREDYGLQTFIARYHNVYGPNGTFDGGREKAPAAICRKVINAKLNNTHEIEIWGDGEQTRSFMYIDDCVEGSLKLFDSSCYDPINIGSDELVSINQLVDIVESIAKIKCNRIYNLDAPKGVRGRNSDNTLIEKTLNWSPSVQLQDGIEKTYKWIYDQIKSELS